MPQPTEALIQQGANKPYTINLLNSLDDAINHLEDSETQKVLKKYGFEIYSLIEYLKETKDCVYQIRDKQQHCIDSLKIHIKTERKFILMPENIQALIEEMHEVVLACISREDNTKLIQEATNLATALPQDHENRIIYYNAFQNKKNTEIINFENDYSSALEPEILQKHLDTIANHYDIILSAINPNPQNN